MKVKELIEKLLVLNQDADVVLLNYGSDDNVVTELFDNVEANYNWNPDTGTNNLKELMPDGQDCVMLF